MPKFLIKETMPCWTTWGRVVEADTEEEAFDKFNEGEGVEQSNYPEIGDSLDAYDTHYDIKVIADA